MLDKLKAYGFQALALLLLVACAVLAVRLHAAQLDAEKSRSALSAEREDRQRETTERTLVALQDARETFRKGEMHARNQQEISDAHAKQERTREAALAAATADGQRLRQQVAQLAAACGGGEAQSVAAAIGDCRNRAATLGLLLVQADRLAEEFAGAAEKHADEIRSLKRIVGNDRALMPD